MRNIIWQLAIIAAVVIIVAIGVRGLEITSPEDGNVYNTTEVQLSLASNSTFDSLQYKIDDANYTEACANCSAFNKMLNLSEGNYTLYAIGTVGNASENDSAYFTIQLPVVPVVNQTNETNTTQNQTSNVSIDTGIFTLNIVKPADAEYKTNIIPVEITSNRTLDSLEYYVGGLNGSCVNCSSISANLNLTKGNYVLSAHGSLGNISTWKNVSFEVSPQNYSYNYTYNNSNKTRPRFDTGFEKLPKMVEAGEITDAELAAIIRAYKINPGIINRLIKTGMLGNESLDAILDTQFAPTGIMSKLLSWFGIRPESISSLIYENYKGMPDNMKLKMTVRDDIDDDYAEEIKLELKNKGEEMRLKYEAKIEIQEEKSEAKEEKVFKIAKQNGKDDEDDDSQEKSNQAPNSVTSKGDDKVPPGQAKKISQDDSNAKGNTKVPPGQENKDDKGNSRGRGNGKGSDDRGEDEEEDD